MRVQNGKNASAMRFGLRFLTLISLVNVLQVHWFGFHDVLDQRFLSPSSLMENEPLDPMRTLVATLSKSTLRKKPEWRASVTFRKRNATAEMPIPLQEGNMLQTFGPVNFTMNNGTNILFSENMTHFYCKRRYDRAGSALQDYLMAHAFAFHFRRKFAGACGPNWYPLHHLAQTKMIELLGLEEEILILDECPTANDTSALILDTYVYYMWKDTDVWTPEWIEYMQQQRRKDLQQEQSSKQQESSMVVHIRRGDVHPCDNYTYNRYLPNSHYIALIDQYRTSNHSKVIVHSEFQSRVEPWMDFDDIDGIEFKMDTDPVETWRDILNADVFIMSLSSFSLVAALFSKASKIVYSPFWHRPQPQWIRVSQTLMTQSESQKALLRENKCSITFDSIHQPLEVSQKTLRSMLKVKKPCHPSNCTRW